MKTTLLACAIVAVTAFSPLAQTQAEEAAQKVTVPTYKSLHHVKRILTPVLDKKTVALKVQQQGYSRLSRFSIQGGAFRLNATNPKGENVIIFVHPELGIILGEKALDT